MSFKDRHRQAAAVHVMTAKRLQRQTFSAPPPYQPRISERRLANLIVRALAERLAAYGVLTLDDWRALGPRRTEIFGITTRTVRELDSIAEGTHRGNRS